MTREAAIRALGAIGLPECCLALREVLLHDGGWFRRGDWLRVLAAQSLTAIPDKRAEGILSEGARCRSAAVRRACEQALAGRDREGAVHDP
jgi:HEAT repeat protein